MRGTGFPAMRGSTIDMVFSLIRPLGSIIVVLDVLQA
jgi:hypothetical protein